MPNMIEINNKTKSKIDARLVKGVARKFLTYYNKESSELSIAFVGDKTIRGLNKAYRGIDKTTDVLAFSGEDKFLGEIIINYPQVKKQAPHQRCGAGQAKKFNNSIRQELIFILTHGLLHLLGYDDKTEKGRKEMEDIGEEFIKAIGNL